ncbi:hypothetical protein SAMN04487820_105199 [Actinopolyspora mzabensis]|uniref:Uncharacterized protein n=1 Tax=Actinopolyspora mzabensis TaxID=995066 RepID=A0A1G9A0J8_ACTMZ|nr:hypothetical protein SAMN04487820_105199 [Actinopolyspora mzabensis]
MMIPFGDTTLCLTTGLFDLGETLFLSEPNRVCLTHAGHATELLEVLVSRTCRLHMLE